ncbi:MAG TPA: AMP-binding protein [Candidatus Dormibacteraeota bacterium]|nr:AMP-binding protein [Candidatus Dormibacteraeota bacterium]
MIFPSRYPDVSWPDVTVTEAVFRHADRLADRVAVIDGMSGRSYTYGQLRGLVRRFAGGLGSRGFGHGDVVALLSPNVPEYPIAFHGTCAAGAVNTTLNPLYTAEEIGFQLRDSGARMIVTVPQLIEKARAAAEGTLVEEIVVFGEAEGATPFATLVAGPEAEPAPVSPADDLAVLPYSSGTTGISKGVMLTHHNLVANLHQVSALQDMGEDDVILAVLPFFHIYGMNVIMNLGLFQGCSIVSLPRFELDGFLSTIERHRVTWLYVAPPIVVALAKHPSVAAHDLTSVKIVFSGAAPLDAETAGECARRIGCPVIQGYGLTETSPVTHCVPSSMPDAPADTVGYAIPNVECKVVSVDGRELGAGEDGELWIRGPNVMRGYLNNPTATADCIDGDGFFHTGDIGHVDEEDRWYIVDRLKELIKYKGFQVAPAELEALLLSHPAIADAAVIGVPDLEAGESPKGFVVLKDPAAAGGTTPDEIMAFVAERVAPHKKLRLVEIVDEIPKSASGKILRRLLREQEAVGRRSD